MSLLNYLTDRLGNIAGLSAGNLRLGELADPIDDLDAVNKRYLDQKLAATWPTATPRFFMVDWNGGSDTNIGYQDGSPNAALAVKTWARLREIFPQVGAGRIAKILVKPRIVGGVHAIYRNSGDTANEDLNLNAIGYAHITIAGTTDFSNTVTDKTVLGARTAITGPNGDGSWTVAAGATINTFTVGAGTFAAEPAAIGYRIRFTGNITSSLANVCRMIHENTTTTTVVCHRDLPATPADGDTFFVEEPGAWFNQLNISGMLGSHSTTHGTSGILTTINVVGIKFTSTLNVVRNPSNIRLSFVHSASSLRAAYNANVSCLDSYIDETPLSRSTGMGIRATVINVLGQFNNYFEPTDSVFFSTSRGEVHKCSAYVIGAQSVFWGGLTVASCGTAGGNPNDTNEDGANFLGTVKVSTTNRTMRCRGQLHVQQCHGKVQNINIFSAGASPALKITGTGMSLNIEQMAGSTGNTDVGIDFSTATHSNISLGGVSPANTLTGSLGDCRVKSSVTSIVVPYASIGLIHNDTYQNHYTGGVQTVGRRKVSQGATAIDAGVTMDLGTFTRFVISGTAIGEVFDVAAYMNDNVAGIPVAQIPGGGLVGIGYWMERTTNANEFKLRAKNNDASSRTLEWLVTGYFL